MPVMHAAKPKYVSICGCLMTLFCRGYVVWPAGKCGDPAARYGPFRPVAAPSHRLRIQRQNVQSLPVSFPYFRIDKAVHWLSLSTSSTSTIYSLSLSTSSTSTITHCHFTLSCVLKKEPPSVLKVKYCELKQRFMAMIKLRSGFRNAGALTTLLESS
jgi:hypothetical protein